MQKRILWAKLTAIALAALLAMFSLGAFAADTAQTAQAQGDCAVATPAGKAPQGDFSPDDVLVVLKRGASHVNAAAAWLPTFEGLGIAAVKDLTAMDTRSMASAQAYEQAVGFKQILKLTLEESGKDNVEAAIRRLEQLDTVESAEPNYYKYVDETVVAAAPNDPYLSQLWGLANINAQAAWDAYGFDASAVKVAIIDSGVANHNDLAGNLGAGKDFEFNNGTEDDRNGHGTHVAGTVGAVGNNGIGVTGVAQKVQLIPCQVSADEDGSGTLSTDAIIAALTYATAQGIPVANASYCSYEFSNAEFTAVQNYPGLLVAAAGNYDLDNDTYTNFPATFSLPNIISVAAIDSSNNLSWWGDSGSNYGAKTVHIAAPGSGILSTLSSYPGASTQYGYGSGTSMAAPHVAGAAALIKGYNPGATTAQIKQAILASATYTSSLSGKVATNGRLNVKAAMDLMSGVAVVLSYNLNGGTSAPLPAEVIFSGVEHLVTPAIPTRAGQRFLGWSVSSTAASPTYLPGTAITITENTTLYAVWAAARPTKFSPNSYSISYKGSTTLTIDLGDEPNLNYWSVQSSNGKIVGFPTNAFGANTVKVQSVSRLFAFNKAGSVTIELKNPFEQVVDTCRVNVTMSVWDWIITIVLFGWLWY